MCRNMLDFRIGENYAPALEVPPWSNTMKFFLRVLPIAIFASSLSMVSIVHGEVVGGWDQSRGDESELTSGSEFNTVRNLIATQHPGTSFVETPTLTPDFLSSIDVLMISVVYGNDSVPISPYLLRSKAH